MSNFSGLCAAILRNTALQTQLKPCRLRGAATNFPKMVACLILKLLLSWAAAPQSEAAPKPIVEWLTEREHDFQHLRKEHPKTFVFRFKNIDDQVVLLQTVRTSCGCTAATWTETPIAPGETGEVEVEYDAYQRGEFRKKIKVFFDRQRKPEILWIRGEVD